MGCVLREGGRGMIGMDKVIPGGEGEGADGKELIVADEEVDGNDEGLGEIWDGTDERLVGIDERCDGIDERHDGFDKKFSGIDEKFGGFDEKFGGIDEKFGVFGVDSAEGKDISSKIT
ncbi:hypothetical protein U1Q18_008803 [Sarracenia purpurea var. burkii]